jgi:hypothetical protein
LLCASARVRTTAAVRLAMALGVGGSTDGAAGHLIRMKAGRSAGRCRSTVIWSDSLIWPVARVVGLGLEVHSFAVGL